MAIVAALAVSVTAVCAVAVARDDGRRLFPRASYDPFHGSAAAPEWVAYGDHAAVVRVTREKAGQADPKDGDYIPRTVTATVTRVIWSRPGAPRLPKEITLRAHGWYTTLWGGREEAAREGAPRLEPGHTYVVGVGFTGTGNGVELIGDDAAVPYDAATFGQGELEGRTIGANAYRRAVVGMQKDAVAKFAVSETYNPKTLRDVQRLLEGTSPLNLYRQTALTSLQADVNLDRKPDDHADEGTGTLPGTIRHRVLALDSRTEYFLSVACSGPRGAGATLGLTVNGTTDSHKLSCDTSNDLVRIEQPRGEVSFEITAAKPSLGAVAVAWNVSEALKTGQ
ncbi:hypothetical protein ACFYWX_31160 [Streptomyces sp. NPDC002888]|uniref:hypothetical protein n=1 Tax=Streptomyces sp. NPDC002888 TaxID=3364668 RepID=UPI0036B17EBA